MTQSSLLVGLLAAAFLLYVAAKGRLPVYTNVLWGPAPKAAGSGGGGGGDSGPDYVALAADAAKIAAMFA